LLVLPVLSACSPDTPGCKRAEDYARRAELSDAADTYAQAQRAKEGSCAGEGLERVTQLQADSLAATARGHAAESVQDLRGAESAYDEALKIDDGNAEAAAGLRRVTQRPATIDPVWFKAQRLLDEGYDREARAEVIKVLRKHPDRTVPESLAKLSAMMPTPSPTAQAPTTGPTAAPSVESGSASTSWIVAALALLAVALLGAMLWTTTRQLRRSNDRTDSIETTLGGLDSRLEEAGQLLTAIKSTQSSLSGNLQAAKSSFATVAEGLTKLTGRADELQRQADNIDQEITRIFGVLRAMRDGASGFAIEHYEQPPDDGRGST
jgi:methyl-accepting chemotaxis protein